MQHTLQLLITSFKPIMVLPKTMVFIGQFNFQSRTCSNMKIVCRENFVFSSSSVRKQEFFVILREKYV